MHADTLNELQQATAPLVESVNGLQNAVGSTNDGAPVKVDDRLRVVMGQDYPVLEQGQVWPMSSRSNYFAIQLLKAQFATLNETVNNTFPALSLRLEQTEAKLAAMQEQQIADDLAEIAQDAFAQQTRALALAADKKAEEAKAAAALAKAQADAEHLTNVAQQSELAAQAKQLLLVQAQESADQQAIAQAQATANEALQKAKDDAEAARQALLAAQAAQTTATQAGQAAGAAQASATQAQASATTAISNAATAQSTATAAQAATTAFIAKFREKRVPTNQMALGATITQVVPWDQPFADDKYSPVAELAGTGFLGLTPTVLSWTANNVTVQIKNTLGLILLAGAGTLIVTAKHD